jgi:predicted DNA-binding transcriptional regulator AlpA
MNNQPQSSGSNQVSKLLTIHDVCELLNISRRNVWLWVAKGILPQPIAFSKQTKRWKEADILKVVEQASAAK